MNPARIESTTGISPFQGNEGDVLVCVGNGLWHAVPGSSVGGEPLSDVWYCDSGTDVETSDGSDEAPYSTIQAACDAAAAASKAVISLQLCAFLFAENVTVPATPVVILTAQCATQVSNVSVAAGGTLITNPGSTLALGTLSLGASSQVVALGTIQTITTTTLADGARMFVYGPGLIGVGTGALTLGNGCVFELNAGGSVDSIADSNNANVGSVLLNSTDDAETVSGESPNTCGVVDIRHYTLKSSGFTLSGGASRVGYGEFVNSHVAWTDLTVTNTLRANNSFFSGNITTTDGATFRNCRFDDAAPKVVTGPATFDLPSWRSFCEAGWTMADYTAVSFVAGSPYFRATSTTVINPLAYLALAEQYDDSIAHVGTVGGDPAVIIDVPGTYRVTVSGGFDVGGTPQDADCLVAIRVGGAGATQGMSGSDTATNAGACCVWSGVLAAGDSFKVGAYSSVGGCHFNATVLVEYLSTEPGA